MLLWHIFCLYIAKVKKDAAFVSVFFPFTEKKKTHEQGFFQLTQ